VASVAGVGVGQVDVDNVNINVGDRATLGSRAMMTTAAQSAPVAIVVRHQSTRAWVPGRGARRGTR